MTTWPQSQAGAIHLPSTHLGDAGLGEYREEKKRRKRRGGGGGKRKGGGGSPLSMKASI